MPLTVALYCTALEAADLDHILTILKRIPPGAVKIRSGKQRDEYAHAKGTWWQHLDEQSACRGNAYIRPCGLRTSYYQLLKALPGDQSV